MSRQFRSDDTNKWLEGFGNGTDGDLTYAGGGFGGTSGFGLATFTGTSTNYSGTFSDIGYFDGLNGGRIGDIVLIHQSRNGGSGAGNWELNKITNRSGTTVYFKYPLQNNYDTTAQMQSCGQFNNLSITGTLTPYTDWNGTRGGIVFLIAKSLTVSGTISVNGSACTSSTTGGIGGGYYGADSQLGSRSGEGTSGAKNTTTNSYGNAGGGASSQGNEGAPGGGNGTAGSYGTAHVSAANPGSTAGVTALTTMVFGGGGAGQKTNAGNNYTGGGSGGGIILLIAKSLTISGGLSCNGGAGGSSSGGDYSRSGGGGAGGSILLKCQNATLGSSLITASAGAGGTSTGGTYGNYSGGAGGVGRIHLDYRDSYSGTTNPTIDVTQDSTLNDAVFGYPRIL